MASTSLTRLDKFFGGITTGDKDTRPGVCLNSEEIDIFSNPNLIEPETILQQDRVVMPITITSSGTTATATTVGSVLHGLSASDVVTISGANESKYNGTVTVATVGSTTTFTYTVSADGATSATGTINAYYNIPRLISGFAKDDADNLYALSRDSAETPNYQIWKKTTASASSPGAWTSLLIGAVASSSISPLIWHKWSTGEDYLYFITGADNATTKTIYKVGNLPTATATNTEVDGATVMSLTGFAGSFDRCPAIKIAGEIFFGHGQFIAKITETGTFVEKAFTLPYGWKCVSFASLGDSMAILAKSDETGENTSKVIYWDLTALSQWDDEVNIPMGGPQIIVNHSEVLRIFCAKNGKLKAYRLDGKTPQKTHELSNIETETDVAPIIPDASKFFLDNILYFGLWKTDKAGLYALGQTAEGAPLALVLSRRFHADSVTSITVSSTTATVTTPYKTTVGNGDTVIIRGSGVSALDGSQTVASVPTSTTFTFTVAAGTANSTGNAIKCYTNYANHQPLAAIATGPNIYASYDDDGTKSHSKLEGSNSPTRSSNATYETILIDAGSPEVIKDWVNFFCYTKPIPSGCSIIIDGKPDNDTDYDTNSDFTLTSSNDQTESGLTADTFWQRAWTSLVGRALQVRIKFISSGTSKASLYFLSFLSRNHNLL